MKKQTLFLMAGGLLALASCTSEGTGGYTDAYVDSVVNERVAQIQIELEEQNEARIHALALEKADSILAARAGKPGTTTKKTTTTTTTTTPAKEEPKKDGTKVTDRPGATNQSGTKVTDRPGATNQGGTKVTDRPGAN